MSGDVQPRKRKDKKKQKDDDGYSLHNEDVNIHVHKEGGTGGNICAKIVFFFLFSALIVLIGLIIKENQGLTELEEVDSESRYSQIFEGWVDKNVDEHEDDHSPELSHEHDDHDPEDEDDDHYESEEKNVEETEEEQSEEIDNDEEEQEDDSDSTIRSEEETNEETEEEDQMPESEEDKSIEEDNTEELDEQSLSQERENDETEEDDNNVSEAKKDYDEDDDEDSKEEKSKEQSREEADDEKSEDDEVVDKSEEGGKKPASEEDFSKKAKADIKEEPIKTKAEEETLKEAKQQDEEIKNEPVNPSSGMATKIGVGSALLAVAYNVFFRKGSPEKPLCRTISEKEPTPDLSRRNTLVPPLSLQEVEPDLPEIEGEGEEYSEEEYSDEDSRSEHRSAREEYEELSLNYTRSLTPDGNFAAKNTNIDEEVVEDEEEEVEEEEEELDDEEINDDYDKYDEDEDEELLKRLEAKYGKLGRDVNAAEEVGSDSEKEDYEHSDITNKDDFKIKEDIDAAHEHLNKNAAYANKMFDALLGKYPLSPRTLYGKAKSLDILAEENQSNELLQKSLNYYMNALNAPNVPDPLFVILAERYIDRARFVGQYKKAIAAHWQLIERFPHNATFLNNLAVTYLTINLIEEARSVLKRVLSSWPNDGFALVHYGFILKTADNNLEESVHYMTKGLKTKEPGVIDGRFYFHLGDALTRLNKKEDALKLYEEGVREKVFMSKYQRSLYNVPRLTAKPWWEPTDLPSYKKLFQALKGNWKSIRKEGLSALNDQGYFRDEAENLKDTGTWKQLELFARGQRFTKNCAKNPITCNVIQNFPDAKSCRRGQTKFSVMHPATHVWPHCGPTNCRLRIHLGLKVPANTFIRVAEETRSWKEGDIIIFDDSFEHEVWHNGSDFRLVLIVDVWHPELTPLEKKSLSSI